MLSPLGVSAGLALGPLGRSRPALGGWSDSLKAGLDGVWEFNGDALAAFGGNDLTEVNSPGYAAGQIGQASVLDDALEQHFSQAIAPDYSGSVEFTLSIWLKKSSVAEPAQSGWAAQWVWASQEIWMLTQSGASANLRQWTFYVGPGLSTFNGNTGITISVDTWHHMMWVFDGSEVGNDRLKLWLDGSAYALNYSGAAPAALPVATADFWVGRSFLDRYGHGNIDQVATWGVAKGAADATELWNGSNGKAFS